MLDLLATGATVALITDAGTPGISDPGSRLVRAVDRRRADGVGSAGPSGIRDGAGASAASTRPASCSTASCRGTGRERAARLPQSPPNHEPRCSTRLHTASLERSTIWPTRAARPRQVALARELTKIYETVWRGSVADAAAHLVADATAWRVRDRGRRGTAAQRGQRRRDRGRRCARRWRAAPRRMPWLWSSGMLDVPKRRVYDLALAVGRR